MSGARRIFLYNWPTYVTTWLVSAAGVLVALRVLAAERALAWVVLAGAIVAALWSIVSLAVSYWIYDVSRLASGSWVEDMIAGRPVKTWAAVDAGLDNEITLDGVLGGDCIGRLDVYDGVAVHAPSVERARSLTPRAHEATRCLPTALSLGEASCDLVAVVFTAHEVRDVAMREAFFLELARCLRDGGRVLLVEHLRDFPNFCAFGPGFFHFLPRAEWLRLARTARLRVVREARVTPWVLALVLEKAVPAEAGAAA